MKLYSFVPQDCSGKVRWLLLELGISFEDITVKHKEAENKSAGYLAKHPLGQVPVLDDGDVELFESYAIVQYLADRYGNSKLAPRSEDFAQRAAYLQWLWFSAESAGRYFNKYHHLPNTNEEYRKKWGDHIQEKTRLVLATIETRVSKQQYLLPTFSAVDVCLAYELNSLEDDALLKQFPKTMHYLERLKTREACRVSKIFAPWD